MLYTQRNTVISHDKTRFISYYHFDKILKRMKILGLATKTFSNMFGT